MSEINWINSKNIGRPTDRPLRQKKVDTEVSEIVGREIFVGDPRTMKAVNKWREYSQDERSDNHLQDSKKRDDLKRIFNEGKSF